MRFSCAPHTTFLWSFVMTLALCLILSAPLSAEGDLVAHDHMSAPAWRTRELLPSHSTGFTPKQTVLVQRSKALPGWSAPSKPGMEIRRLTQPAHMSEMDVILSAGTPAELKAVAVLRASVTKHSVASDNNQDVATTAVTASAVICSPLPQETHRVGANSQYLALLGPHGILLTTYESLAAKFLSAAYPLDRKVGPEVIISTTDSIHSSRCAASELNMAPDLPRQRGQLLPPIELQLLSRFGFMPYLGSTAMAVYVPVDSSHATGSSRQTDSTKQGFINSTPSLTDSLLSSSTEEKTHKDLIVLPRKLQQWWKRVVGAFGIPYLKGSKTHSSARIISTSVLDASCVPPNKSKPACLMHAMSVSLQSWLHQSLAAQCSC